MIVIDRQACFEFMTEIEAARRGGEVPVTNTLEAGIARYRELIAQYPAAIKSGETTTAADIEAEAHAIAHELNAGGAA